MIELFDTTEVFRTPEEWRSLLDDLLGELASHLELSCKATSYFIQAQQPGHASYGCHVDFHADVNKAVGLELCGILCFTANWDESVSIGAYLLLYVSDVRLHDGHEESVIYLPRSTEGWQPGVMESGAAGEWSQYRTPKRWH